MRQVPIDTDRIVLIGTGKAAARQVYAELSDGTRQRVPDKQAEDDNGRPLWVVDVLVLDEEATRAEVVGVKVASFDEPVTVPLQPVKFRGLVGVLYVDQRSGRAALSLRADGIEGAPAAGKSQAAA